MDDRCRACSTAERTATNIVLAPIVRASRCSSAPYARAPRSSRSCSLLLTLVLPAPHARAPRSSCSCSLLLMLVLPAPHTCAPHSSLALPALSAPAPCSSHSCSSCSCSSCSCSSCSCSSHSCSLCSQLSFRLWHCSQTFLSTTCVRYSIFRLCFSALSLAPWTLPLLV